MHVMTLIFTSSEIVIGKAHFMQKHLHFIFIGKSNDNGDGDDGDDDDVVVLVTVAWQELNHSIDCYCIAFSFIYLPCKIASDQYKWK